MKRATVAREPISESSDPIGRMLALIDGEADRLAALLLAEHGVCGEAPHGSDVWPLHVLVTSLETRKWDNLIAQFEDKGDRLKASDLSGEQQFEIMRHAYALGIAVGRRLGPQALTANGGGR